MQHQYAHFRGSSSHRHQVLVVRRHTNYIDKIHQMVTIENREMPCRQVFNYEIGRATVEICNEKVSRNRTSCVLASLPWRVMLELPFRRTIKTIITMCCKTIMWRDLTTNRIITIHTQLYTCYWINNLLVSGSNDHHCNKVQTAELMRIG